MYQYDIFRHVSSTDNSSKYPPTRANSFPRTLFRTLCRRQKRQLLWNQSNPHSFCKTPGVGVYWRTLGQNALPETHCSLPTCPRPAPAPTRSGFSWSYELLFPQVLSFHKDPNCPGCGGQAGWNQRLGRGSDGKADGLHRLHADFALLLRAGLANPYHLAPEGAQRVLIQDQFKGLP